MNLRALSASWTAFAPQVANHLWQSTFFVVLAAMLAFALRKNHARIRYWIWLTASLKFLVPFSLLIVAGSHLATPHVSTPVQTVVYSAVEDLSQPFVAQEPPVIYQAAPTQTQVDPLPLLPLVALAVWLAGIVVVAVMWIAGWIRISSTIRQAVAVDAGPEIDALRRVEASLGSRKPLQLILSPDWMEPGIFGIFHQVLIWPEGISEHLDDRHIEAILAHEVCHVRRRDNLTAVLHMLVEAIFWFHPLVWWMGAKLEAERERACDEAVSLICRQPKVYAESILRVCKFCSESPLACVSGITGADLKKRILQIMSGRVGYKLGPGRKLLLAAIAFAVVAVPFALGQAKAGQRLANAMLNASPAPLRAMAQAMIAEAPAAASSSEPSAEQPALGSSLLAPDADLTVQTPSTSPGNPVDTENPADFSGNWQGTLHLPDSDARVVLHLNRPENGNRSATLYRLDETPRIISVPVVKVQGDAVEFTSGIPTNTRYVGNVSADGRSMVGIWSAAGSQLPLTLVRPAQEVAWELPPIPVYEIAPADADPSFATVTINPHDQRQPAMLFEWRNGRNFRATWTLARLIEVTYGVHPAQLLNAPAWFQTESFDFLGVPDMPGMFTQRQRDGMIRKMLEERFHLKLHREQRSMPVFLLTVVKSGPRMTPALTSDPGASMFSRSGPNGGRMVPVRCATMLDFVNFLQGQHEVNRPVIDQTGIQGRHDFDLTWNPEGMRSFRIASGSLLSPATYIIPEQAAPNAPPGLLTALEEQVGLKLTPVTAPVDVLVIDHVEFPAAN